MRLTKKKLLFYYLLTTTFSTLSTVNYYNYYNIIYFSLLCNHGGQRYPSHPASLSPSSVCPSFTFPLSSLPFSSNPAGALRPPPPHPSPAPPWPVFPTALVPRPPLHPPPHLLPLPLGRACCCPTFPAHSHIHSPAPLINAIITYMIPSVLCQVVLPSFFSLDINPDLFYSYTCPLTCFLLDSWWNHWD